MPSRGFTRAHLKRQCTARLRAHAEPRVYPRPCEAAVLCPFTGTCRAAGLPAPIGAALLVDDRMGTVVLRTDSDNRNRWCSGKEGSPSPSSRLKPRLGAYR